MLEANRQLRGIVWMIFHCFLFALMSVIVRMLSVRYHVLEIVFFHNAFSFLMLLPWLLVRKGDKLPRTRKWNLYIARAVLAMLGYATYFTSVSLIPLTQVTAITLASPLVTTVFAVIFIHEKIGRHRVLGLVAGFIGALIVTRPGTVAFEPASLLVVVTLFFWAACDMLIKVMARTESTVSQVFYMTLLMTLLSTPTAIMHWKTPVGIDWLWMAGLGFLFMINIIAVFKTYSLADVSVVTPFTFFVLIFAAVIAYIVFGEVIDFWTCAGSLVIIISTAYVAHREAMHKQLPTSKEAIQDGLMHQ